MRRHRPLHQDLGSREQEHGRGAPPRGSRQCQVRPSPVPVHGLVRRRSDFVRRILRQHHPRLAGVHGLRPLRSVLAFIADHRLKENPLNNVL